jgi:hypothetical protein
MAGEASAARTPSSSRESARSFSAVESSSLTPSESARTTIAGTASSSLNWSMTSWARVDSEDSGRKVERSFVATSEILPK